MSMTPREIVEEIDKHIVGQSSAKRSVAVALRNRWRRAQVEDETLQAEMTPKNILMIGPTGVGKTEISRRLARLAKAPFIKVEATKFTEVGYVGREVDSIVRDLADMSIKMAREEAIDRVRSRAEDIAEDRILDALLPPVRENEQEAESADGTNTWANRDGAARQRFRKLFREGKLNEKEIEIEVSSPKVGVEIMGPPGMEEMTGQLQNMFQNLGGQQTRSRKVSVAEAARLLTEEAAGNLINDEDIK